MKRIIIYAIFTLFLLCLSGCKTSSEAVSILQTSVEKAEKMPETFEEIPTTDFETSEDIEKISAVPDTIREGSNLYNAVADFISQAESVSNNKEIYCVSSGGYWVDDGNAVYADFFNSKSGTVDGIVNYYAIVYSEDMETFCSEIEIFMNDIQETLDEMYLGIDRFNLYVNDINNEHIVSIGNDGIVVQDTPTIYWHNASMREKYSVLENIEKLSSYNVKIVNK